MEAKHIIYPKVPVYVRGPVAPLHQEWETIAKGFENAPGSLYAAWLYLGHHPAFWTIQERPEGFQVGSGAAWYQFIEMGVEGDGSIWMEIRPSYWPDDVQEEEYRKAVPDAPSFNLEITETTYEEAVLLAAATVYETYGNDREFLEPPMTGRWQG